jgi:spore coat protein U-like protein
MKMTKLFLLLASIGVFTISFGREAAAQTATANLNVTASVIKACTIGVTPVAFSPYDPTASAANTTGQGTVTIKCTPGTAPTVALGLGNNIGAGNQRNMKDTATGGTNLLKYGLFQDSTRKTTPWGDGTLGGIVATPSPTPVADNNAVIFQVYGQIPALQSVVESSYADLVVATVNF